MDIAKVVKAALRLAGYNILDNNIERSQIYKQATSILDDNAYYIQKELNTQSNTKIAILSEITETKKSMFGDFDRYSTEFYVYSLPHDYIQYVGSTFSKDGADVQIMNNFVLVKKDRPGSMIDDRDETKPWFIYKRNMPLYEMDETVSRYVALFLAKELLVSFKSNDANKISLIERDLEKEKVSILRRNNKLFALKARRGRLDWRY